LTFGKDMTYDLQNWVEDLFRCLAWQDQPGVTEARGRLEKEFATRYPQMEAREWTIDRMLVAYLWVIRHAAELDIPAAIVGKDQFVPSRYLCEALYRVCMRLQSSDLHREFDVSLVMKLTAEQKALDPEA